VRRSTAPVKKCRILKDLLLNKDPTAQDPAARARTDEAPGSPTGEFVSGTAVSPYEFGTYAVQQYHSQYPKISLPRRWSLTLGVGASVVGTRAPLVMLPFPRT
jgi:hypothetical protein